MFTDRVKLKVRAGKGGNGVISWRREKFIRKGGPCGGDGGKGGSIILEVDPQIHSLEWYRNRRLLKARNGEQGGTNQRTGRNGQDLVLKIPAGTLVKDRETGELIADLCEPDTRWTLCAGGGGGKGNINFKTPTNQAPNKCTPGKPGEERDVELELKLIADVGLVGFPNAGKSTLISSIAKVRVKVAPYPFTTRHPNLGYIEFDDYSRVLIADIPGIIEGAHENRGLGFEFLRHIERTEVLIFMLDASGIDGRTPWEDFQVLRHELESYDPALLEKPYLVALNKCDTDDSILMVEEFHKHVELSRERLFEISALEGKGMPAFVDAIRELAQANGKRF